MGGCAAPGVGRVTRVSLFAGGTLGGLLCATLHPAQVWSGSNMYPFHGCVVQGLPQSLVLFHGEGFSSGLWCLKAWLPASVQCEVNYHQMTRGGLERVDPWRWVTVGCSGMELPTLAVCAFSVLIKAPVEFSMETTKI